MKSERSSFGFAFVGLVFGGRNGVEHHLEGDDRPFGIERFADARVQLPEPADDVLRPELAASPNGPDAGTLARRGRLAPPSSLRRARPEAPWRRAWRRRHRRRAAPFDRRPSPSAFALPADSRGRDALVVFARPEKHLPDFEKRDVAQGPACIALRGGDEARNEARAHVGKLRRDRIGERERRRTAAEQFRRGLRPTTRSPPRAAKARRARFGQPRTLLQERQHGLWHALIEPGQWGRRRAVDAGDAQNLLDDVGLDQHVRTPRRRKTFPSATSKPRRVRVASPSSRDVDADQPLDLAVGEGRANAAVAEGRRQIMAKVRRRRSW